MTKNDILKLANRGFSLNGYTLDSQGAHIDVDLANREYLKLLASAPTDLSPRESDAKEVAEAKASTLKLMKDALDGDRDALRSLNSLRIQVVDNVMKAKSNFLSFFEIVTLGESDIAAYVNTSNLFEVSVTTLSQEGKPYQLKVEKDSGEVMLKLENLTTKEVGYRIEDINRGNIKDVAIKTLDLAGDMAFSVDRRCYNLLTATVPNGGCYGAFSLSAPNSTGFTGKKYQRIYVPHSGIDTSHFPTTNDLTVKRRKVGEYGRVIWLDASDATVATESLAAVLGFFGPQVFQDAIRYVTAWGDCFGDGRLSLTGEIIVPASDIIDLLYSLGSIGVNLSESELQKQVQENGFVGISLYGINWKLVPDHTIPSGTCYPKTNKQPGIVYLKPSWDKEFVDTDLRGNWETRSQRKAFQNLVINQHRVRTLRITYK